MSPARLLAPLAVACLLACGLPAKPLARPAPPRLLSTVPPSPAPVRDFLLLGEAEPGTRVHLFASAGCHGAALAVTGAAGLAAGVALEAVPATRNVFTATATSQVGQVSDCSEPLEYDFRYPGPPASPTLLGSVPASPSPVARPRLFGTAPERTTVRLYRDGCGADLLREASGEAFADGGVEVPARENAYTRFFATAVNADGEESGCGAFLTYTHDSAPPEPAYSFGLPGNFGFQRHFTMHLAVEPDAVVRLYDAPGCVEPPLGGCDGGNCYEAGVRLTVRENATSRFHTRSEDRAGNDAGCVDLGARYTHDPLTPPVRPSLGFYVSQPQTASDAWLWVYAQPETTADLFEDGACDGGAFAAVVVDAQVSPGTPVSRDAGVTATYSARARNDAGVLSDCSTPLVWPAAP